MRLSLYPIIQQHQKYSVYIKIVALSCFIMFSGNLVYSNQAEAAQFRELLDALRYEAQQHQQYPTENHQENLSGLDNWQGRLRDQNEAVRYQTALQLGVLGRQAPHMIAAIAPELIEKLESDPSAPVRYSAALALGTLCEAIDNRENIVPHLLQAASKDENSEVRDAALIALTRIGPQDHRVIPALMASMEDSNGAVRDTGAEVLASWAIRHPLALQGLVMKLAQGTKPEARSVAAYGIGKMGAAGKVAIPSLTAALNDPSPKVRNTVLIALKRISDQTYDPAIAPVLVKSLADNDVQVARRAHLLLLRLSKNHFSVVEAILSGLEDKNPAIRAESAYLLGWVDTDPNPLIDPLIQSLKDLDPRVRQSAAFALGSIAPPNSYLFSELVKTFAQSPPTVSKAASKALRKQEFPAIPAVIPLLFDAQLTVRLGALSLLFFLLLEPISYLVIFGIILAIFRFWRSPKELFVYLFPLSDFLKG